MLVLSPPDAHLRRHHLRKTSSDKQVKGIGYFAIVVLPTCLYNEQRRVFSGIVVVRTIPSPLQQRPESFDGVGVYLSIYVLVFVMPNYAVFHNPQHTQITFVFIGPVIRVDPPRTTRVRNFMMVVPDKSAMTRATTFPPRSTAPSTFVFFVPRPLGLGVGILPSSSFLEDC